MPASKAHRAEVADRRAKLIKLRRQGVCFDDPRILALGYTSRGAASKDLVRALEERRDEQAAEISVYRQEENERLDALLQAAWPRATQAHPVFDREGNVVSEEIDLKAVDTILKLMDRRAKLLGLDAPVRTELSGPDGGAVPIGPVTAAELHRLIGAAGDGNELDELPEDTG
ncbi:hypothetical protein [Streptomyces sp. NPDC093589]|uniref:hypothetical protein n=1 Tax=Streptomyces sp. NPDC093589 TaxID=3366043 RepID=UPI003809774A